jgi:hypothetical protein
MPRARALAIAVLLLSYGSVGARQPAVRSAVPLPVPARVLAAAAGLPPGDSSALLLHVVRIMFDSPEGAVSEKRRAGIRSAMWMSGRKTTDKVALPLDPSIWRETILERQIPDRDLVAAILEDRNASLLYHGLCALDDETLASLGPDQETLRYLRLRAPLFATFGRSIRVSGGRVLVPGGTAAEGVWTNLTGVDPGRPAAFIQRIFRDDDGRLAFLYDAVGHLDAVRQRFALGLQLPESSRDDRLRALLDAFADSAWRPFDLPFSRPPLDASVVLSSIAVTGDGEAAGPMARGIWERVFSNDTTSDATFSSATPSDTTKDSETVPVDAAWLAARISRVSYAEGRRRLDTVLFAQRVFRHARPDEPATTATALRGFASFPSLMLALERMGITEPATFAKAAEEYSERLGDLAAPDAPKDPR